MPFFYRPLTQADRNQVLSIFGRNVPYAFGGDEIADYETFLDALPGPYFVVELDGLLVGACGYALLADQPAPALSAGFLRIRTSNSRASARLY